MDFSTEIFKISDVGEEDFYKAHDLREDSSYSVMNLTEVNKLKKGDSVKVWMFTGKMLSSIECEVLKDVNPNSERIEVSISNAGFVSAFFELSEIKNLSIPKCCVEEKLIN